MKAAVLALSIAACTGGAAATPDAAPDAASLPVACDGALCATDNGGSCSAATADPGGLAAMVVAIAAVLLRRRAAR